MKHEEFAERAGRRLETVADRLEGEGRRLGIDSAASKTNGAGPGAKGGSTAGT